MFYRVCIEFIIELVNLCCVLMMICDSNMQHDTVKELKPPAHCMSVAPNVIDIHHVNVAILKSTNGVLCVVQYMY